MEDQQIETLDNDDYGLEPKAKKPIFLIVICIISLVESGWGILGSLFGLVTSGFKQENLTESDEFIQLEEMQTYDGQWIDTELDYTAIAEFQYLSHWLTLAGGILVAIFVFAMLKRKKAAFYPFVFAKIALAAIPMYLALRMESQSFMATMLVVVAAAMAVHHLVFILLFSKNLKHMR